ncbi:MAG: 16S rRNA (guanine(966)-N(2))-methyltransferase RsmD [Saccharofermentans sp.]|nr:16S rRNA (guanine(966)-N(2))-methyltransferase RsmD [Saccharofermentans sp.]
MPRVVTGMYRGTVLEAPKGDKTRPTTDKVKEALFSIIQARVPDSDFLDLCAGSGQIGIEALSRGANSVVLVDKAADCARIIKGNISKIHMEDSDSIRYIKGGIIPVLENLAANGDKFDIIFMDPPYRLVPELAKKASEIISGGSLLKEDGILIVEHAKDMPPLESGMSLEKFRSCSYGLTVITFFKDNK